MDSTRLLWAALKGRTFGRLFRGGLQGRARTAQGAALGCLPPKYGAL
jgi:hypothetical protein